MRQNNSFFRSHLNSFALFKPYSALTAALIAGLLLVGCNLVAPDGAADGTIPAVETPTPVSEAQPVEPLSPDRLANATYRNEFVDAGVLILKNGIYQEAGEGAAITLVNTGWAPIFGDLNGDSAQDAVMILVTSTGGSGTFYEMHAMINESGVPVNVANLLLGDRILLNTVRVDEAGDITIRMKRQGADDPLCCPSEEVVQRYVLVDNALVLEEEEIVPQE